MRNLKIVGELRASANPLGYNGHQVKLGNHLPPHLQWCGVSFGDRLCVFIDKRVAFAVQAGKLLTSAQQ